MDTICPKEAERNFREIAKAYFLEIGSAYDSIGDRPLRSELLPPITVSRVFQQLPEQRLFNIHTPIP
jgi:hypothetical protein